MRCMNLLLVMMLFTVSCSPVPELELLRPSKVPGIEERCSIPFPVGEWQFIHSIEALMPGGRETVVIGIIDISPGSGTIHCVIVTIEGLVLFDALYDKKIIINRGIHPFGSTEFARGLVNDIKLMFFRPAGELIGTGVPANGSSVCRYGDNGGPVIDVITNQDQTWEIRKYMNNSLSRSVKALLCGDKVEGEMKAIPCRLELRAYENPGYELKFRLIKAERLTQKTVHN